MSNNPFFSICIPNYNYAHFIGETIQSVLDQSFQDFEIIIVDNASTDSSWEVIQSYARQDNRINIHRNNYNVGFAPNLQKASERAIGKFMILLSSDDIMYPDALQSYHEAIQEKGEDIVLHAGVNHINPKGEILRATLFHTASGIFHAQHKPNELQAEWTDGALIESNGLEVLKKSLLQGRTPATFLATCYPRKLWEKVEGYDLKYIYSPDAMFLYKLLSCGPALVYLKKRLFGYRVHNTNQAAQAINSGALKQQLDRYNLSFGIEKSILQQLELERGALAKVFVNKFCHRESLIALSQGYWLKAFKLYFFSWSTYPGLSFKRFSNYYCLLLLLLGPFGTLILKGVQKNNS